MKDISREFVWRGVSWLGDRAKRVCIMGRWSFVGSEYRPAEHGLPLFITAGVLLSALHARGQGSALGFGRAVCPRCPSPSGRDLQKAGQPIASSDFCRSVVSEFLGCSGALRPPPPPAPAQAGMTTGSLFESLQRMREGSSPQRCSERSRVSLWQDAVYEGNVESEASAGFATYWRTGDLLPQPRERTASLPWSRRNTSRSPAAGRYQPSFYTWERTSLLFCPASEKYRLLLPPGPRRRTPPGLSAPSWGGCQPVSFSRACKDSGPSAVRAGRGPGEGAWSRDNSKSKGEKCLEWEWEGFGKACASLSVNEAGRTPVRYVYPVRLRVCACLSLTPGWWLVWAFRLSQAVAWGLSGVASYCNKDTARFSFKYKPP